MRLPSFASTSALRAWCGGVALAFVVFWLPLRLPFGVGFYLVLLGVAVLALYSLTVQPRAFAASGVLLGIAPSFAWGVIDGLQKCARFNRGGPSGGCEADPSSQLLVTTMVYVAALIATAAAARSSKHS